MTRRLCSVEGCDVVHFGYGYCNKHYWRWRKHGDPLVGGRVESVTERFWMKVDKSGPDGCWLWNSNRDRNGYGRFWVDVERPAYLAHKYAYETLVGPVPNGLELDHLCRVPACLNPAHLEPVTHRENMLRGNTVGARNAAKTHCPQGHPYDEENTYWYRGNRHRQCRTCGREQKRRA